MPTTNEDLDRAIATGLTDEVVTVLVKLKPWEVALLKADGAPAVKKVLNSVELNPFWEEQFNKVRIKNVSFLKKDPGFQFRDPTPQTKADFFCGYALYIASQQVRDEKTSQHYLSLAMETFNSFHAYQKVLEELILGCKEEMDDLSLASVASSELSSGATSPSKTEKLDFKVRVLDTVLGFLCNRSNQVEAFKTPGLLLLSTTYFYLAGFYQELGFPADSVECYKSCWMYLNGAQLLEGSSVKEIHNAYFGQGIVRSNPYGFTNIEDMKTSCLKIAQDALPAQVRNGLEARAQTKFAPIDAPSGGAGADPGFSSNILSADNSIREDESKSSPLKISR